jgi:hypothetical protein
VSLIYSHGQLLPSGVRAFVDLMVARSRPAAASAKEKKTAKQKSQKS